MIIQPFKKRPKRSRIYAILGISGCLSWILAPGSWCLSSSQVLKAAGNKRLEASICGDSMNRIAVANDRICQIFGDEGTFESQSDEGTGQVFLKPTSLNGAKSLSLTLITEQGLTQDLTLKPTAMSATTLILTRDLGEEPAAPGARRQAQGTRATAFDISFGKTLSLPEQALSILKLAIAGQLPEGGGADDGWKPFSSMPVRQNPQSEACTITFENSWQAGAYTVQAYLVENLTETPLELQEKDFYQPGDLALSFKKGVLPIGGTTMFYVVSHATRNGEARNTEAGA